MHGKSGKAEQARVAAALREVRQVRLFCYSDCSGCALSAYVTSIDEAAAALGLRAAPSGGNVLPAVPEDKVAFERTMTFDRVVVAAPSQVAADLLGGPGRAPEEGRVLLEWMEANEPAWRQ